MEQLRMLVAAETAQQKRRDEYNAAQLTLLVAAHAKEQKRRDEQRKERDVEQKRRDYRHAEELKRKGEYHAAEQKRRDRHSMQQLRLILSALKARKRGRQEMGDEDC